MQLLVLRAIQKEASYTLRCIKISIKVIEGYYVESFVDVVATQINSSELLQTDATIIAGVLVLLTISVIYDKGINSKIWKEPLIWCASMPIAFIISAASLVLGSLIPKDGETYYGYGVLGFVIGLAYLIIAILIIISILIQRKREKQ